MSMNHHLAALAALVLAGTSLTACAQTAQPAASAAEHAAHGEHKAQHLLVHKSPNCGCCELWVEHMREGGFDVEVRNVSNVHAVKQRLGVPAGKASCHTAQIGGYVIEGHVPAEDVKRLLAERPDARGLTVPGMPKGSPGMEVPDGSVDPYTVELIGNDGAITPYAQHGR